MNLTRILVTFMGLLSHYKTFGTLKTLKKQANASVYNLRTSQLNAIEIECARIVYKKLYSDFVQRT